MEGRSLLVSDVDNTLLGDEAALRRFAEWRKATRHRIYLAYASGRFVDSVLGSVLESDLPRPDAIIGGVGSEIHLASGEQLNDWPRAAQSWNAQSIRSVLDSHDELNRQPDELQSEFKISYFGYNLPEQFIQELKAKLAATDQNVEIVYSSQRDLDVLPPATNKGTAAVYLADYFGVPAARVIVTGDSGNDVAMFTQTFRGVVIANAQPELKRLDGSRVYHSNLPYADGVLDGVRHWWRGKKV